MADDLRGAFEAYREEPLGPGDRPSTEAIQRRGRRWLWRRRGGAVLLCGALIGAVMATGRQLDEFWQQDEAISPVTSTVPTSIPTPTSVPPTTLAPAATPGAGTAASATSSSTTSTTRPESTTRRPTTTTRFVKEPLRILRPVAGATVTEATAVTVAGEGCFSGSAVSIGLSLDGSSSADPIGRGTAAADGSFAVQTRIPEMGFDEMPETRLRAVCDGQTVFSPIVIENA